MGNWMRKSVIAVVVCVACVCFSMTRGNAGESTIQTSDGQTWVLQADGGYRPIGSAGGVGGQTAYSAAAPVTPVTSAAQTGTSGNVVQTADGQTWVLQSDGGYVVAGSAASASGQTVYSGNHYSVSSPVATNPQVYHAAPSQTYHQQPAAPAHRGSQGSRGSSGANTAGKVAKGLFRFVF